MATYDTSSVYALTPMNSNLLGLWEAPEVTPTGNEVTVTIERHMRYRPDLLSYSLYGSPKLWWIFKMLNPDKLNDPIWDFKEGTQIIAPKKSDINAYLG